MLFHCKISLKPCFFLLISNAYILMYLCGVFQGQENDATAVQEDENKDASCMEELSNPAVFVNTRRGKGNCTKRKISDTATVTECDAQFPPSAAEVLHVYKYATLLLGSLCKWLLCIQEDFILKRLLFLLG